MAIRIFMVDVVVIEIKRKLLFFIFSFCAYFSKSFFQFPDLIIFRIVSALATAAAGQTILANLTHLLAAQRPMRQSSIIIVRTRNTIAN